MLFTPWNCLGRTHLTEGSRISVSALNKRCQFRAVAASPGFSSRISGEWCWLRRCYQAQRNPGSRERCRALLRAAPGAEKRRGSGCSACSAAVAGGCFAASKRDFTGREKPGTAASELSETPSARLGAAPTARAGPGRRSRCRWCPPRWSLTGGQQTDLCPRLKETRSCLGCIE